VEARNSCARILIFGSFLLLSFVKFFFPAIFRFFDLSVLLSFLLFDLVFLSPFVFLFFFALVLYPFFLLMWFHLLPTPTCLGIKGLDVVDAATLINGERHAFY
jgi:hypothetical protein